MTQAESSRWAKSFLRSTPNIPWGCHLSTTELEKGWGKGSPQSLAWCEARAKQRLEIPQQGQAGGLGTTLTFLHVSEGRVIVAVGAQWVALAPGT
jgi:hypothetical protein